jgi:hypothetical protein
MEIFILFIFIRKCVSFKSSKYLKSVIFYAASSIQTNIAWANFSKQDETWAEFLAGKNGYCFYSK